MIKIKILRLLMIGLALFMTPFSLAAEDEFGGTTIAIQGCTSEGHQAVIFYRVLNFSPWDMNLPEGTVRASMQETWDAAQVTFQEAFQKVISRHLDSEVTHPNFAADIALEAVDEKLGRMDRAFYETKKLLYDQGKYSALSVNYEKSGSQVNIEKSCP